MHEVTKKVSTVALAAVLLFCSVVPVPIGAAMFDRARVNQAYANPIAGTAAEMALLAFETACVAGGIYIAGTTLSELNINAQEVYDAFTDYYTAQNDISQSELEAILAGSYTNGNIDLSALTAAGITGAIPGFAQVLINDGKAVNGVSSNLPFEGDLQLSYETIETFSDPSIYPYYSEAVAANDGTYNQYLARVKISNGGAQKVISYVWVASDTVYLKWNGSYYFICTEGGSNAPYTWVNYTYKTDGTQHYVLNKGDSLGAKLDGPANSALTFQEYNGAVGTYVSTSSAIAAVAGGVIAGTFAGTNQGIVQAFNPTADQLQAGYDASILQGVEQAVADLGTISTGIAALDATMNGLLGVCQGIASTLSNTVVGQYCAAVTQWLGATPFGTVMGTVIDGLDDIPDAVADGAAVVAGGVAALPGALEGVIEGVLEGVFGQPLAIPGFLQDILAGVQAIPGALEGAIEGINFPGPEWPELPRPESGGEPFQIALPPAMQADFEADLRERVPFCYVIHMKDAVDNLSGNLSYSSGAGLRAQSNYNMRSFYFDVDIPFAGPVHFDAEPFLSQPFGALDIATTIRILATALLCFGLLYRSYKVVERSF